MIGPHDPSSTGADALAKADMHQAGLPTAADELFTALTMRLQGLVQIVDG